MFAVRRDAYASASPAELTDVIGHLHGLMAAVHHELLAATAAYDERELWKDDGATSMATWLVAALGVAQPTANAWADVAERLTALPALAAAYADGSLSFDQLRPAARWARPDTDADVAAQAPAMTVAQLQAKTRRTPTDDEAAEARRRRSLRWWRSEDNSSMRFSGRLPIDEGALVAAALERIAQRLPRDDEHRPRAPFDSRCADALVELASQQLADDTDANRATVVVHAPLDAVLAAETADATAEPAVLDDGSPLAVRLLRRLLCDSRIQTVVDGPDGPVGVGRTTRTIPPWLMRLLRHRDQHCRFPGCGRRANLQAHHIRHWVDGGPTDLDNLVLVCWHHHHWIHDRGATIDGHPNGRLSWRKPGRRPVADHTVLRRAA